MTWVSAWRKVADNTGYIGVVGWLLLFIIKSSKKITKKSQHFKSFVFFLATAFFSLILSLGKYTPVYKVIYQVIPFFSSFRGPTEALLIFNFSMGLVFAFVFEIIFKSKNQLI